MNVDRELTTGRRPRPPAPRKAVCPFCRRTEIRVNADGCLRSHRDGQGLQCRGSGRKPN